MKKRFATALLIWSFSLTAVRSQDWKQVHPEDDAKWAHMTGLSAATVHNLWRMASHFADENDDDSRIDQIDLRALSARNHVLLVTSSGEDDCLRVSVFQMVSAKSFRKLWSEEQTPEGRGFCATRFGRAEVQVWDGVIEVIIPEAQNAKNARNLSITAYQYGWENGMYRFFGTKHMVRTSSSSSSHLKLTEPRRFPTR
jgi:hypothetical protein